MSEVGAGSSRSVQGSGERVSRDRGGVGLVEESADVALGFHWGVVVGVGTGGMPTVCCLWGTFPGFGSELT